MGELVLVRPDELRQMICEAVKMIVPQPANVPAMPDRLATEKELCQFLKISAPTAIRYRQKGKIPFIKVGVTIRYNLQDVVKALSKHNE